MNHIPKHTIAFIDNWLELRSKWSNIPGFSVAIAQNGETLLDMSYGFAEIENNDSLTPQHLFHIASHSKTFTATTIMQLYESSLLHIDDTVATHLTWLKTHKDSRWKDVTIRQLLSHSSGVIRDGNDAEYWKVRRPFPTQEELIDSVLETNLVLESNTQLKYSNYGYGLLGLVIEKVTGASYSEAVRESILTPLELTHTYPDYREEIDEKFATGYSRTGISGQRKKLPHLATNGLASATGFCSTAADLLVFWQAQRVGSGKLLSDASKREMQRLSWEVEGEQSTYGLGITRNAYKGRSTIGHSGGYPGFATRSAIDIRDGICVIVLTNAWDVATKNISDALYSLIDEMGGTVPDKSLLKYEGRFDEVWGMTQFYANSQGLRQISPNSWYPLEQVEELEHVENDTFRYSKTSGYSLPGEQVTFEVNNGQSSRAKIGGSWAPRTAYGDIDPDE